MVAFTSRHQVESYVLILNSFRIACLLVFNVFFRLAPNDWENPHPCDKSPEELENIWHIKNSCWLTMGSIMTQGSDILPK